ncbi:MAG: hypothetical protein VX834_02680 [Myxococcota bacterium]|nr:hypothetical protein [Myxococcota bacterium]
MDQAEREIALDEGIHLRGTPIWFDASRRRTHCVLTGLGQKLPPRHERVLCSGELASILDRAGYRVGVLPANWQQWLGFGGRQLKLVELGSGVGEAVALVDDGERRLLICGDLPRQRRPLPQVDHVVMSGRALEHEGLEAAVAFEQVRILAESRLAAGDSTVVGVEALDVGLAVLRHLEAAGMPVRPRGLLAKAHHGSSHETRRKAVVVALSGERAQRGPDYLIDSGLGIAAQTTAVAQLIPCRWYVGLGELKALCNETQASMLSLYDCEPSRTVKVPKLKVRTVRAKHQAVLGL